jgi:hypothetical protein
VGYCTEIEGKIYYGDSNVVEQQVIEKIVDMIDFVQWGCSASYGVHGLNVNYYTRETEWIHYANVSIDKGKKEIDLSGERKNYYNAVETLLNFTTPYLNKNNTYMVTMQGEEKEDYSDVIVKDGSVFVNGEKFVTNNQLSFPFPLISNR